MSGAPGETQGDPNDPEPESVEVEAEADLQPVPPRDRRSTLSIVSTPIGNLEDVTLRVLAELAEADVVLCEDTRHTRGLLDRHGIKARLLSYHEHNEAARHAEAMERAREALHRSVLDLELRQDELLAHVPSGNS